MPCFSRFAAFALLVTATAAMAEPADGPPRLPCHDYRTIAETLGKRYGETPVSLGLQTNGHVLQVFTSKESGSWTILSVAPTGIGCIVAAGQHWQSGPGKEAEPRV
jgi:hypothetical protein